MSTSQKALKQGTGSSKRRLVTVPAQEPAKEEGSGLMTSALNFWKVANRKLADLEDKLLNQVKVLLCRLVFVTIWLPPGSMLCSVP